MLLNPFCPFTTPFTTAKVLALKAAVLLQTLLFLAIGGGLALAAGGAALFAMQQRRTATA